MPLNNYCLDQASVTAQRVLSLAWSLTREEGEYLVAYSTEGLGDWKVASEHFSLACELSGVDIQAVYDQYFEVAVMVDEVLSAANQLPVSRQALDILVNCALGLLFPYLAKKAGCRVYSTLVSRPIQAIQTLR